MRDSFLFIHPVASDKYVVKDGREVDSMLLSQDEMLETARYFGGVVRVLGRPDNVRFIAKLLELPELDHHLQFCTGDVPRRTSGMQIVHQLHSFSYTNLQVVNWFDINDRDKAAIRFAASYDFETGWYDRTLLQQHPAWPAVSYIKTGSMRACAELLAGIGDIRFFYHPLRHDRLNRLINYLGIRETIIRLLDLNDPCTVMEKRLVSCIRAWGGNTMVGTLRDDDTSPIGCSSFPLAVYASAMTRVQGLLKATQAFVRFVRSMWMFNRDESPQVFFDPDIFFKVPEESQRYKTFVSQQITREAVARV